jgi:Protein of unknown function (DUF3025)
LAHGLEAIDWSAPWLAPYKGLAEHAAIQATESTQVCDLLKRLSHGRGLTPVDFVPQSHLPAGAAYEQFIFDTKQCPTRNGLHDFFNGLCWHQFPQIKTRLNQLQAEQIALLGSVTSRGHVRDALTVFDENAAFLFAPPKMWQALLDKDWQRLFVTLRPLWKEAQMVLFGHALLEKLVSPRKPITAHVYICNYPGDFKLASLEAIDAFIAADLTAEKLATKPFAPIPVLGVPNWCGANEEASFYADEFVFRRPKVQK